MKETNRAVTFRLPKELWQDFQDIAEVKGRAASGVLRDLIRRHNENFKKRIVK